MTFRATTISAPEVGMRVLGVIGSLIPLVQNTGSRHNSWTEKILFNYVISCIDNSIQCIILLSVLNDIQFRIAQLQNKGWTLAALADELGITPNAIEKWKSGDRNPNNTKAVIMLLDKLVKRKRIPKKRRYQKSSDNRERING